MIKSVSAENGNAVGALAEHQSSGIYQLYSSEFMACTAIYDHDY